MSARPPASVVSALLSAPTLLSPADPRAGASPGSAVDCARWAGVLAAVAAAWQAEAERLAAVVRDPVVTGPCAAALVACGDVVAAEIHSLATDLGRCGAELRLGRPA
jgi:hypothetical protein